MMFMKRNIVKVQVQAKWLENGDLKGGPWI